MREQHAHFAVIVGRSFRFLEGLDDDGVYAASASPRFVARRGATPSDVVRSSRRAARVVAATATRRHRRAREPRAKTRI